MLAGLEAVVGGRTEIEGAAASPEELGLSSEGSAKVLREGSAAAGC